MKTILFHLNKNTPFGDTVQMELQVEKDLTEKEIEAKLKDWVMFQVDASWSVKDEE